jgi:uncharacterized membrane protein
VFKLLLAVHVLVAVFAVGPLVQAATTAGRGVRTGDAAATASAARIVKIYSYASVLVVVVGMGLMSVNSPFQKGEKVGAIGDVWIWLSLVLWLVAVGIALGVVVPGLAKATEQIGAQQPVTGLTARIAASGGAVGLLFAAIVVLMVYRPGD